MNVLIHQITNVDNSLVVYEEYFGLYRCPGIKLVNDELFWHNLKLSGCLEQCYDG